MPVAYPFGLRTVISTSKSRTKPATFAVSQPRRGYGYVEPIGTDVPVFWDVVFRFTRAEAEVFRFWFLNALRGGELEFSMPIDTEFGLQTYTLQFLPDSLMPTRQTAEVFEYSAQVMARRETVPIAVLARLSGAPGGTSGVTIPNQTATQGSAISVPLAGYWGGGVGPFTYAVVAGTLPAGVSLNATTGTLVGTPSAVAALTGIVVSRSGAYGGPVHSNAFSFTVTASGTAPAIVTHPANQSVLAGATATFTAAASGSPAPTVQWERNPGGAGSWSPISGATSTTYTTPATTVTGGSANNTDTYRAVFTNGSGSATTNAATLTVAASDPLFSSVALLLPFDLQPGQSYGVPGQVVKDFGKYDDTGSKVQTLTAASGKFAEAAGIANSSSSLTIYPSNFTNGARFRGRSAVCLEGWVKVPRTTPGAGQVFLLGYEPPNTMYPGFPASGVGGINVTNDGVGADQVYIYTVLGADLTHTVTRTADDWHHVAMTVQDRNVFRCYVDGVLVFTHTESDPDIYINEFCGAVQFYGNGLLDDIRFTDDNLRYTGAFTPPTAAHPRG